MRCKLAMTGLLDPVYKEVVSGHAEVKQTFQHQQGRHGCRLLCHRRRDQARQPDPRQAR